MEFEQLGLSQKALDAVRAAGYAEPTPIQEQAIPPAIARRDVLGLAQTGSGKTAAFVLPMLMRLESGRARARMPRSLIIEPTRELAAQVHEAFETLGANHRLTVALLIGGVSFDEQDRKIDRGADVVIATPGRLLDHFERGKLLLHGVDILVVDEADRMLDMGFIPDIERICKLLPLTRQTLFYSATMPPEIQRLTNTFLHNPARIAVALPSTTAASIVQRVVLAPFDFTEKREALRRLLRAESSVKNAIVFANRKTTVALLETSLLRHKFDVAALHGDMDQYARLKTLDRFRAGQVTYLIASDVAARGLDIPEVSHIFNFDVPHHPEDYVHRVGRTGRAGREGHAFTLVARQELKYLRAIEALTRQTLAWVGDAPGAADAKAASSGAADSGAADPNAAGDRRRGPRRNGRVRRPAATKPAAPAREAAAAKDSSLPATTQHRSAPAKRSHAGGAPAQAKRSHADGAPAAAKRSHAGGVSSALAKRVAGQHRAGESQAPGLGSHVPAFLQRPVR